MDLGVVVFLVFVSVGCVSSAWDCKTQLPFEYTAEPQTWPPPYRIQVYPTYFEPGSKVQVEIRGNFDSTFEGFYLQARRAEIGYGSLDEAIGQFDDVIPPFDTKVLDCDPGTLNAWTHGSNIEKHARIINWTAPDSYEGPIVFRATIIRGPESVFFANVKSPVVNSLSELHCYDCYYTETDGIPDEDRDNKEACYYFPWVADVVKCADELSLPSNFVYRCYTSEWKRTSDDGEVVVGIRRGCTGIEATKYGEISTTSDIDDIQDIFSFTLDPDEQQSGRADLCYSPGCNDQPAELQCYKCKYKEVNGVPDSYDNKYDCFYDPSQLEFESCDLLPASYTNRCYTSVYRKITRDGDFEQGIRRGCVAVKIDLYGSLSSTSDINEIEELFDFELLEGDVQTGTADLCNADFCNDEPAELLCYKCKYDEINGIADPDTDNREACYYHPSLLDTVNCEEEEEPLELGEIFRCYTSRYTKWTIYGDMVQGIRRGCIAVQRNPYATLPLTSDIQEVQEIFDFTLPPGDVQTGTADFCDTDYCNDDDGLQCHTCLYSENNGVGEQSKQSRDICNKFPFLAPVVNCLDEGPLMEGQIHRCFRSEWLRNDANGDVRTGISRGCVAIDESQYDSIPWTTDIRDIQDIFGFTLGPGDRQEGIADFCDSDKCNDLLITQPEWNPWSPYTELCSRSCGGGTKTRTRTCDDSRPGDDEYCEGPSSETISCNTQSCPISPEPGQPLWTSWSSWGLCTVTCGYGGSRARTRVCVDDIVDNIDCEGHDYETVPCSQMYCPSGGMWTTWSSWGGCSAICGYGERLRTRSCSGSDDCEGHHYDSEDCYIRSCDIEWAPWTSWGSCSAQCGNGERQRSRICIDPLGNNRCEGSTRDTEVCRGQNCDEDGEDGGLNIGVVIGITVGVLAFLILCLVLFLVACWIAAQPRRPRPGYVIR